MIVLMYAFISANIMKIIGLLIVDRIYLCQLPLKMLKK